MHARTAWLAAFLGIWVAAGLIPSGHAVEPTQPAQIVQIPLSVSNMYLIKSAKPVLIDAGSSGDMPDLVKALSAQGLKLQEVSLAVLTHAHSDHAGLARKLQRAGIKLALGKGDVPMAQSGHNDDLKPTNLTAYLLKHLAIDPKFPSFTPDILVDDRLDLSPWGLKGHAQQMPGHTPGALVVHLDDGRSFVGDMFLGGYLGGRFSPSKAGEHYFHADAAQNLRNIQSLLKLPIKTFYLGHGGPVDRDSVMEAFGR